MARAAYNAHITDMSKVPHRVYNISYSDVLKLAYAPLHHETTAYFQMAMDVILNVHLAMMFNPDKPARAGRNCLKKWIRRHKYLQWKLKAWVDIGEKSPDFIQWFDDFKIDLLNLIHVGMNVSEEQSEDSVIIKVEVELDKTKPVYLYLNKSKMLVGSSQKYVVRKGWRCYKKYTDHDEAERMFEIMKNSNGYKPVDTRIFDEPVG